MNPKSPNRSSKKKSFDDGENIDFSGFNDDLVIPRIIHVLLNSRRMPFNSITNALAKEGSFMYGRWISWSDISNCNSYTMGVIPTRQSMALCERLTVSFFCSVAPSKPPSIRPSKPQPSSLPSTTLAAVSPDLAILPIHSRCSPGSRWCDRLLGSPNATMGLSPLIFGSLVLCSAVQPQLG
ncbi:hypothetical protein QL285_027363 [Trifolium repens]|nr:hypothetical protein QL285_027363 [Trifolium repens]